MLWGFCSEGLEVCSAGASLIHGTERALFGMGSADGSSGAFGSERY